MVDAGMGLMQIRSYRPTDRDALDTIAVRTGDAGNDAGGMYRAPELLGHLFVAPYITWEPDLAFVAVDDDGVAGYALGARDVRELGRILATEWWPDLCERYPLEAWHDQPERWMVEKLHAPVRVPDDVAERYPSEFHVDLLPRGQGLGLGPGLIDRVLEGLRDRGSPGVHCGVDERNHRALGFYAHQGFERIETDDGPIFVKAL